MSLKKPIDLSINKPSETPISNTIMSRQGRGISNQKSIGGELLNTVKMNYKRIEGKIDIAKTIMSRDYKGFNTGFDTQNGVIEKCQNQE